MQIVSRLKVAYEVLIATRTIRAVLRILFSLAVGHSKNIPNLIATVISAVWDDIGAVKGEVNTQRIERVVLLQQWVIAEVYSFFPGNSENTLPFPKG